MLPPYEAHTVTSFKLRLEQALLVGAHLGIIHEGHLLPGGFSHQAVWAGDAKGGSNQTGLVELPELPTRAWPFESAHLMGHASHWGHFFTDTLDRLLAIGRAGEWDRPLLADSRAPCANAMELMLEAGVIDRPIEVYALDKGPLHAIRCLEVYTLTSAKPMAPVDSLVALRARLEDRRGIATPARLPLFVGRKDVQVRKVDGQDDLVERLASTGLAEAIFPEQLAVLESHRRFQAHDTIVLPIGSAKFNLAFCRPGTRVVCIAPKGYAEGGGGVSQMLRHMCAALDLDLSFYACRSRPSAGPRAHMRLHDDLVLGFDDLEQILGAR